MFVLSYFRWVIPAEEHFFLGQGKTDIAALCTHYQDLRHSFPSLEILFLGVAAQ